MPVAQPRSEAVTSWKRWLLGPTLRDRALVYEELASLTSAGIGVRQAIESLRDRARGRRRRALAQLADAVAYGVPVGEALVRFPEHFSPVEARIVEAGERTGRLDRAFRDAAAEAERARAAMTRLLGATAYPVFLFHFALFVPIPMLMQRPWPTVWTVLALFWGTIAALATLHVARRDGVRYAKTLAHVPVLGPVLRCAAVSRATRIAGLLHDAGTDLHDALRFAAGAAANGWVRADLERAADLVASGVPVTQATAHVGAFPIEAHSLIQTGEHSGNLGESLAHVARIEDERFAAASKRLAGALFVLLILTAGLGVFLMFLNLLGKMYGGF